MNHMELWAEVRRGIGFNMTHAYWPRRDVPEIEGRLAELLSLEHGWDGYRGEALSPETAARIRDIVSTRCAGTMPRIVPGSSGEAQLEWHEAGFDIEIMVGASGPVIVRVEAAMIGPDGIEMELHSV